MKEELVSIIIPSFNRRHVIRRTLDSIVGQRYQAWECIVVDDGSTDGTERVIQEYVDKDKRFKFFQRDIERKGASTCRNIGIAKSSGEFVIFFDSDDVMLPNCLERRIKFFKTPDLSSYDYLVFSTGSKDKKGNISSSQTINKRDHLSLFLRHQMPWTILGPVWKRDALLKLGGFDESFDRLQDVELHTRAILAGLKYADLSYLEPDVIYMPDGRKYHDASFIQLHMNAEMEYARAFTGRLKGERARDLTFRMKNAIVQRAVFGGRLFDTAERMSRLAYSLRILSNADYLLIRVFIHLSRFGLLKLKGFGAFWMLLLRLWPRRA